MTEFRAVCSLCGGQYLDTDPHAVSEMLKLHLEVEHGKPDISEELERRVRDAVWDAVRRHKPELTIGEQALLAEEIVGEVNEITRQFFERRG